MPSALFVQGNSTVNIKNGDALLNEKGKQIVKVVFGEGPKDEKLLVKGVYKNYGIGKSGFNVSSIQFAIHYVFENILTLNNFLKNVAECTKLNGYFIGTSYAGETIFRIKTKIKANQLSLIKIAIKYGKLKNNIININLKII